MQNTIIYTYNVQIKSKIKSVTRYCRISFHEVAMKSSMYTPFVLFHVVITVHVYD